jgi:hypothetical protein
VPLAVASAGVIALAVGGVLPVKQVTLHGVEAIVSSKPTGTQVDLIVDVETKLGLSAGIVSIDLAKPITVRYKAIGFSLGWNGRPRSSATSTPSRRCAASTPITTAAGFGTSQIGLAAVVQGRHVHSGVRVPGTIRPASEPGHRCTARVCQLEQPVRSCGPAAVELLPEPVQVTERLLMVDFVQTDHAVFRSIFLTLAKRMIIQRLLMPVICAANFRSAA